MTRYLLALALLACNVPPPSPVAPVAPDADASPALGEAGQCQGDMCCEACVQMTRICGKQLDNCIRTQARIESRLEIREPGTGKPQTCADVAAATDTVQMRAVGVRSCGQ
jgi:hypothetical protein